MDDGRTLSGNLAGVHATALAYLRAIAASGADEAKPVMAQMKRPRSSKR